MVSKHTAPAMELWYDFGSNYSYLSIMRVEEAADRHGVAIVWKPVLLGAVFKALGWQGAPLLAQQEKLRYVWQDMLRQCEKYRLPWTRPSTFPRNGLLSSRVALLGADMPWIAEFNRQVMLHNFQRDRDINSEEEVGGILADMGLPAESLLKAAQSDHNKQRLRGQTQEALDRGLFGAPTFLIGDAMFWGNDRLDDALLHAATDECQSRNRRGD